MSQTLSPSPSIARRTARDPRLDFFRGLGMFIILIAHIPNNAWADWIPARFGFSDATEIFVFCSGVASSFAFGPIFERSGWVWGTRRIVFRIWQVYRGHVGVFIAILALLGMVDHLIASPHYLRMDMNLGPFLDDPAYMLFRFVTLTYVPNYFDILPMYLVILAMVPMMVALARYSRVAMVSVSLVLWAVANLQWLELTAEPWTERGWFFNPFAWQLVFFTGFALGRGWLPPPVRDRRLFAAAVVVLVACAPFSCHWGFSCYGGWGRFPWLADVHEALFPLIDKTHFGAFRYLHFLALAYVAFILAGEGGRALRGRFVEALMQVGRQTLAVFLAGLALAQLLGVMLDFLPYPGMSIVANVGGCAALMLVAKLATAFKERPGPGGGSRHQGRDSAVQGDRLQAPSTAGSTHAVLAG